MGRRWLLIVLIVLATHAVLAVVMWDINRGSHAVSAAFHRDRPHAHGEITVRFAGFGLRHGFAYHYTVTITGRFEYQATYLPTDGVATIELRGP